MYNPEESWSNNSSNMSFGSRKLYSYSSVLAKNISGAIHIDTRIANYSNSSQKQANHLRRAISPYIDTFEYDFSAESAPHWYMEQILFLLDKQSRARTRDYISTVLNYLDEALLYMSTYNWDRRTAVYKQLVNLNDNRDDMLAQVADVIEADKKAKLRAKRKHDKQMQQSRQTRLDKFTGGGVVFDPDYNGVYLKRDGDKLHTTNSVTVDFASAKLLYWHWFKGTSIVGTQLEHYTVVKSTSKSVQIGCTTIGAHELHRIFGGL